MHEIEVRWRIFRLLAPYFGKVVSASFIQKTEGRISGHSGKGYIGTQKGASAFEYDKEAGLRTRHFFTV